MASPGPDHTAQPRGPAAAARHDAEPFDQPDAPTTSHWPDPAQLDQRLSTPKYFTADHQVRVSKVVGASVYNDQNQSIGSIDDMLMSDNDHKAPPR